MILAKRDMDVSDDGDRWRYPQFWLFYWGLLGKMQINQWICRVPHLEERKLQRWEGPEGIDEPLEATLSSGAEMGELI